MRDDTWAECQAYVSYYDGSNVLGKIKSDLMSFTANEEDSFRGYFGCINFEQVHSLEANGILGLGNNPKDTIIFKWFEAELTRQIQFSFCLGDEGGYFQLGRDPNHPEPQFMSSLGSSSFYKLEDMGPVNYGRQSIFAQGSAFILDTGSTITYFPKSQVAKVYSTISKACQRAGVTCATSSQLELNGCFLFKFKSKEPQLEELNAVFPKMDFSIGGKIFSWLPKHMFHIVGETTEYGNIVCIGVAGSDSHSILGDNWMRSNRITINLEERLFTMNSAQTCKFYPHLQDSSYFSLSKSFTSFLVFIQEHILILAACFVLAIILFSNQLKQCTIKALRRIGVKPSYVEERGKVAGAESEQVGIDSSEIQEKNSRDRR